jgi:hypothetical protein
MGYIGFQHKHADLLAKIIFWMGVYPLISYRVIDRSIPVPQRIFVYEGLYLTCNTVYDPQGSL